jgi:hypothetical protein
MVNPSGDDDDENGCVGEKREFTVGDRREARIYNSFWG